MGHYQTLIGVCNVSIFKAVLFGMFHMNWNLKNLGKQTKFSYFHNSLKKVLNIKELNKKFIKKFQLVFLGK